MSPQQQQGQQPESHMGVIWIVVLIFIVCGITWYFGHQYLIAAYFALKSFEISIIQFFTVGLEYVKQYVVSVHPDDVTFSQAAIVASEVGKYLRVPLALVILIFALLLFFKSSKSKYRTTYTMKAFLDEEIKTWPQEITVAKKDLINVDIDKGPWAMAMQPLEFAERYELIDIEKPKLEVDQLSISSKHKITLRRDKASKIFASQMGRPWEGPKRLPIHVRALFAVFASKIARDSKASQEFLYQMSRSASGNIDFSGANELIEKYANDKNVTYITNRHAYVFTVMASLIKAARLDGVLPTSEFIWLKPIDRRLWFMLNAVGRQTATVEVAGPFAHWLAEIELGEKMKAPMIEKAIDAFDIALREVIYKPKD